jgi:hypothetical protein
MVRNIYFELTRGFNADGRVAVHARLVALAHELLPRTITLPEAADAE